MTDLTSPAASSAPNVADRLHESVGDLHVPEPSADAESLLVKLGVALPALGVVLILAAWWNSAGSKYVADQVPMLISGAILGTGLILVGVGLFIRFSLARLLRFWLVRMVAEQQAQTDRVVDAMAAVEQAIRDTQPPRR